MARQLRADDVLYRLADLFVHRRTPEAIRSDNGPEFTDRAVRQWPSPGPRLRWKAPTKPILARIDVCYVLRALRVSVVESLLRQSAFPFERPPTGPRNDCPVTGFPLQRLGRAGRVLLGFCPAVPFPA